MIDWFYGSKNHINDAVYRKQNGINVVKTLSGDDTYMTDESKARYVLEDVIGEDEDSDAMVVKDDQTVFIKNRKTGQGVLTLFD